MITDYIKSIPVETSKIQVVLLILVDIKQFQVPF